MSSCFVKAPASSAAVPVLRGGLRLRLSGVKVRVKVRLRTELSSWSRSGLRSGVVKISVKVLLG